MEMPICALCQSQSSALVLQWADIWQISFTLGINLCQSIVLPAILWLHGFSWHTLSEVSAWHSLGAFPQPTATQAGPAWVSLFQSLKMFMITLKFKRNRNQILAKNKHHFFPATWGLQHWLCWSVTVQMPVSGSDKPQSRGGFVAFGHSHIGSPGWIPSADLFSLRTGLAVVRGLWLCSSPDWTGWSMQFILQQRNCSPSVRSSSTERKWIFPGEGRSKGNLCQAVVIPEETRGCWSAAQENPSLSVGGEFCSTQHGKHV